MITLYDLHNADLNKEHPPLCVDCNHVAKSHSGEFSKHRCFAPENYKGINLIDGDRVFHSEFCIGHRTNHGPNSCQVIGLWFKKAEPKPVLSATPVETNITSAQKFNALRKAKITANDLDNL